MRAIAFDVTEQGSGYIRRCTPQHQQSPLTTWAFTSRGFASTPPQPESWTSPLSWWSCPASSLWPSSSWRVSLRPRGSGAPVWEESEAQSADRRTSSATYRSTWPPVSRGPSSTPSPSSPPSPTSSTTVSDKNPQQLPIYYKVTRYNSLINAKNFENTTSDYAWISKIRFAYNAKNSDFSDSNYDFSDSTKNFRILFYDNKHSIAGCFNSRPCSFPVPLVLLLTTLTNNTRIPIIG